LFSAIHQIKNQTQRNSFKEHKTTNGVGKMLIDFKQNICIGMCSEQESQQYYNQSQRQLLGIWVETNRKEIFFDILSNDLTKDGLFVYQALQTVFKTKEFLDLKIKELHIWSDGAAHFKNQ